MPERDLHVVAPHVGGAFGQKMVLAPEYAVTVWLARHFGVSVRWIEDRRENLIASFHGRHQRLRVRGAFDSEGRLLALDGDVSANVGAYSSFPTTCGVEPLMAMTELPGAYSVPQYRARARAVATNTCPMAPYRGVSRPVIVCGMERLMDRAAQTLGADRLELRRRNLVDSFPHTTPTGIELDAASYLETLDSAEREADPAEFQRRQDSARRAGRRLGLGFSVFNERTGYGTPAFGARRMGVTPGYETVDVAMDASGHLELRIGACPHGQGLATSLAQLVADELGVSPAQVRVIHGDTDRTPFGWGTFASRSMVISGGASLKAAGVLGHKIRSIAAAMMEASPHDLVLADGTVAVAGTDRSVTLREVARKAYHQAHTLPDGVEPGLTAQASYDPAGTFSNACHVAEVEVDVETGTVAVQRYIVVEDAGRLINPMIVDGQIMGGVTQGIANALFEEILYDETGNAMTATLADYLVPTAAEIPRLELHHMVTESDATVTRAKGLGEGGAIGAPAAILNAVNDALAGDGVEIETLPATPRRIREALRAAGER
jgi:carbon-monoxide dehydrogenase large subunit